MNKINFLPPWVETNLQPAFYDLESGTALQQTSRMYAKVNQLIRNVNEQNETIADYIQQFIDLHDYVYDYFDNLDVQEEINNKLDEMADQGQLADIISQYLNSTALFGYDTVADMVSADNLVNGSYAETLGRYTKDDGAGGIYKIRTREVGDIEDGIETVFIGDTLTAELTRNNPYIEDVTCEEHLDEDTATKYWITHIPHKDKYGNVIKLKVGLADDEPVATGYLETARSFAVRHKATFVANAGISDNTSAEMTGQKYGMVMKDGVIISNTPSSWWQVHWALGITADNELVTFGPVQTEEEARALGCVNVISGFTPLMINGVSQKFMLPETANWFTMTETTDVSPDPTKTYYTENGTAPYYTAHSNLDSFTPGTTYYEIENTLNIRQMIGQNSTTKDIYFISTNGRGKADDRGMTVDKCIEIFTDLGCDFAYMLDGGGSTSAVYHDSFMNTPYDYEGTQERPCGDFLYVSYEDLSPYSDELNNINKRVGDLKRQAQLMKYYDLNDGQLIPDGADLNDFNRVGTYYSENRAKSDTITNKPTVADFPAFDLVAIYAFKLTVEKMTDRIYVQTLICEGVDNGTTYKFTRQYSHDGSSYKWRKWVLVDYDTQDVDITVEEGYTISNKVAHCKDGRVCISFELTGTFTTTLTKVMSVPSKYKPSQYTQLAGITNSSTTFAQIQVRTNGDIYIATSASATKVRGVIVYDLK